MRLIGEEVVAAPRQRVWEALNDPEVLRAALPGCQSLDRDGTGFIATVEVRIGPISARFKGALRIADPDPPNGYRLLGEGGAGIVGTARGSATVRLSDVAHGATLVAYDVDADVGGRLAQLGGPLIEATARQLAAKFFARLGEIVGDRPAAAAEGAAMGEAVPAAVAASAVPRPILPPSAIAPAAGGYPWAWAVGLIVAVLAGFAIGRLPVPATGPLLLIAVLIVLAISAGYEAGRRGSGR